MITSRSAITKQIVGQLECQAQIKTWRNKKFSRFVMLDKIVPQHGALMSFHILFRSNLTIFFCLWCCPKMLFLIRYRYRYHYKYTTSFAKRLSNSKSLKFHLRNFSENWAKTYHLMYSWRSNKTIKMYRLSNANAFLAANDGFALSFISLRMSRFFPSTARSSL